MKSRKHYEFELDGECNPWSVCWEAIKDDDGWVHLTFGAAPSGSEGLRLDYFGKETTTNLPEVAEAIANELLAFAAACRVELAK